MSSDANNETAGAPTKQPSSDGELGTTSGNELERASSVIVDPTLAAEAAAATDAEAAAADADTAAVEATAAHDAADAQADVQGIADADDGAWAVGRFSEVDADRFADSMRPSWDVRPSETEATWAAAAAPQSASHVVANSIAERAPSAESDGLPPVVIARGLDRRMLAVVAGGLLLIVLAVWSMVDHAPEPPPSWTDTNALGSPASPSATPTAPRAVPNEAPPLHNDGAPIPSGITAPVTAAPAAQAIPAAAPEPTQPVTPSPAKPVLAPAPVKPASVHVRISTDPAHADLKLDGDAVPNPFDAWVARGGSHAIVASADGYTQREWSVSFEQDQTLSLVLKRVAAKRPAKRRIQRQKAPPSGSSAPRGAGFVTDNPY